MLRTSANSVNRTSAIWHITRQKIVIGAMAVATLGTGFVASGTTSFAASAGSSSSTSASQAASYPLQFDSSLTTALVKLQDTDPMAAPSVKAFYSSYVGATRTYGTTLLNAAEHYAKMYQSNPADARNQYIDAFGNARAVYFNSLETARNKVVSDLSGKDDVAKDTFINAYNTARDKYNNQLEWVKNQIASLN